MQVHPLDWEAPLEEGMAKHSIILAWRIPLTEEPGGLQSVGLQTVGHDSSDLASTHNTSKNDHWECFFRRQNLSSTLYTFPKYKKNFLNK